MGTMRLTGAERAFFSRVAETVYSNPFSIGRTDIEARFPAVPGAPAAVTDHHFSAIAPPLEARLAELERRGLRTLGQAQGEDRELLRHAFLFQSYHRHVEQMDRLIEEQLRQPDRSIPAPFAERQLAGLTERGFSHDEAVRYFALFFQLRRAFYFIDRALVGTSASMGNLRRALWNCIFTEDARVYDAYLWNRMEDFSTLLLGETGTGKGAAAAAIGRSGFIPYDPAARRFSTSFTQTFIATNLSQFPEGLIESELFGHRKGAFTGAIDHHKGLFERCSAHGSLFLDEIGEVSAAVQIKLLKVLQERTFTPVGSHEERRFSGRVIAATNRTREELRAAGFRDDFFYRLSSQVITMPPLRQRIQESPEELPQLVHLLLARTVGAPRPELAERVLAIIRRDIPPDYPWPGNVRELEQAIRRALLTQQCAIPPSPPNPQEETLYRLMEEGAVSAQELLQRYCSLLYRRFGTYEEVARRTGLDRRTAKRYVQGAPAAANGGVPRRT